LTYCLPAAAGDWRDEAFIVTMLRPAEPLGYAA
jgi:hypothetical protein